MPEGQTVLSVAFGVMCTDPCGILQPSSDSMYLREESTWWQDRYKDPDTFYSNVLTLCVLCARGMGGRPEQSRSWC